MSDRCHTLVFFSVTIIMQMLVTITITITIIPLVQQCCVISLLHTELTHTARVSAKERESVYCVCVCTSLLVMCHTVCVNLTDSSGMRIVVHYCTFGWPVVCNTQSVYAGESQVQVIHCTAKANTHTHKQNAAQRESSRRH